MAIGEVGKELINIYRSFEGGSSIAEIPVSGPMQHSKNVFQT